MNVAGKKQRSGRFDRGGRERPDFPRLGVGILVLQEDRFVLVKRGRPPAQGKWTLPGGLVRVGETVKQAAERELLEECNITARLRDDLRVFEYIEKKADDVLYHYVVIDYIADYLSGRLTAGSDVVAAAWFRIDDLQELQTTDNLSDFLMNVMRANRSVD